MCDILGTVTIIHTCIFIKLSFHWKKLFSGFILRRRRTQNLPDHTLFRCQPYGKINSLSEFLTCESRSLSVSICSLLSFSSVSCFWSTLFTDLQAATKIKKALGINENWVNPAAFRLKCNQFSSVGKRKKYESWFISCGCQLDLLTPNRKQETSDTETGRKGGCCTL